MTPEQIERLLAQAEPQFVAAWLGVLRQVRDARTLDELATLLASGRVEEAMDVFGAAASRMSSTWNQVYVRAGTATAEAIEVEFGRIGRGEVVVDFDMVNERAVRAMQENNLRLVREFTEAQRNATRQALVRGITRGANPREQARAFRDSIGLTTRQEQAVANFERLLRERNPEALTRQLRDRRFDPTVRRAIEAETPLTERQVQNMTRRYRERFIRHRSEVIARTEALRSVHQGSRRMFDQAVEGGLLNPEQITREWQTANDERVRRFPRDQTSHATMHGQIRLGMDEPFTSGAGNQSLHPGGFGIGFEDIQCRCVVGTRMNLEAAPGVLSVQVIEG